MAIINKYPYTDMHELNLDWILSEIQTLEVKIKELESTYGDIDDIVDGLKLYTDESVEALRVQLVEELNVLSGDITNLQSALDAAIIDITHGYQDADALIVQELTYEISNLDSTLRALIDTKVANITVMNYFTGQMVSAQDMLNYLAQLHVTDGIDYADLASRNKSYTQYAGYNMTYTQLVTSGNSIIV